MPNAELTNSPIVAAFRSKTPGSAERATKAGAIFPSGITHDSRRTLPYATYIARASGSRKWDVDGNEYVDYYGGHGALLLGHCHPDVTAAVQEQVSIGTHYGACHDAEIRWGALVKDMVPSAETVRFHLLGYRSKSNGHTLGTGIHRPAQACAVQAPFPRLARSCRFRGW